MLQRGLQEEFQLAMNTVNCASMHQTLCNASAVEAEDTAAALQGTVIAKPNVALVHCMDVELAVL